MLTKNPLYHPEAFTVLILQAQVIVHKKKIQASKKFFHFAITRILKHVGHEKVITEKNLIARFSKFHHLAFLFVLC